ncbi:MAG: hypothetical protein PVG89_10610 [Gammaproteobacteria bacterium]|jgi:hypothetical protein
MGVVFDEVVADVSAPTRQTTEETTSTEESTQSYQIKREVLQAIERNRCREQRLKAD